MIPRCLRKYIYGNNGNLLYRCAWLKLTWLDLWGLLVTKVTLSRMMPQPKPTRHRRAPTLCGRNHPRPTITLQTVKSTDDRECWCLTFNRTMLDPPNYKEQSRREMTFNDTLRDYRHTCHVQHTELWNEHEMKRINAFNGEIIIYWTFNTTI